MGRSKHSSSSRWRRRQAWVAGIAARWVVAEQPPRRPAVSGQATRRTCGRQHAQRAVRHQRVAAHGGQQLQQRPRQRHRLPHRRHVLHLLPPGWSHGVDAHLGGAGAGAGRRGQTRRARPAARRTPAVWAQSPAGRMPRGPPGQRFKPSLRQTHLVVEQHHQRLHQHGAHMAGLRAFIRQSKLAHHHTCGAGAIVCRAADGCTVNWKREMSVSAFDGRDIAHNMQAHYPILPTTWSLALLTQQLGQSGGEGRRQHGRLDGGAVHQRHNDLQECMRGGPELGLKLGVASQQAVSCKHVCKVSRKGSTLGAQL